MPFFLRFDEFYLQETASPFEHENCQALIHFDGQEKPFIIMGKEVEPGRYCYSSRLFNFTSLLRTSMDRRKYNSGISTYAIDMVFLYDRDIFSLTSAKLDDYYTKASKNPEDGRRTDISLRKEAYKTENYECMFYLATSKDPEAPNKGENPYLILDHYTAACTFKKHPDKILYDLLLQVRYSNRYPESAKTEIDTYKSFKAEVDSEASWIMKRLYSPATF